MQFVPYVFFDGNCREAFEFYARHLGGKIEAMLTHEGAPAGCQVPPDFSGKIMHGLIRVGDGALMASDCPSDMYCRPQGFSVNFQTTTPEEAERAFAALAEQGEVKMPIGPTFWATRFGMCVDRFGIPWMINCYAESAARPAA